jgi:hypothetical protein
MPRRPSSGRGEPLLGPGGPCPTAAPAGPQGSRPVHAGLGGEASHRGVQPRETTQLGHAVDDSARGCSTAARPPTRSREDGTERWPGAASRERPTDDAGPTSHGPLRPPPRGRQEVGPLSSVGHCSGYESEVGRPSAPRLGDLRRRGSRGPPNVMDDGNVEGFALLECGLAASGRPIVRAHEHGTRATLWDRREDLSQRASCAPRRCGGRRHAPRVGSLPRGARWPGSSRARRRPSQRRA